MKYLICLIPVLFACSTVPSYRVEDCEDNLVRFYKQHHQPIPFEDIKQVCAEEMVREQLRERQMNRR